MDVLLVRETQFQRSLAEMRRRGGVAAKAAEEADRIIGRLAAPGAKPADAFGQLTRHGESRIPHCVKFELGSGHRLVCVQTDGAIQLLFVGNHDDCDRWIERNKGLRIAVDAATKRLTPIYEVRVDGPRPERAHRPIHDPDALMMDRLTNQDLEALELSIPEYKQLSRLTIISSDEEVESAVSALSREAVRNTVLSVLLELREGRVDAARAHIAIFSGTSRHADSEGALLREAVRAPVNSDVVVNLRELSEIERRHLFSQVQFQDWLLFLHPDQKPVANGTFDGAALVRGVSGSGKTCVVVHRAVYLARKYPGERIAVVTLNPALAGLIDDLLTALCPPDSRKSIDCLSVAQLCKNLVTHYEPKRPVLRVDPRSQETIEDAWTESFENAEQLQRLEPIIESLARVRKLDAERYIRDEFIWIRSAFAQAQSAVDGSVLAGREAYLEPDRSPRRGRSIQFSRDWRDRALKSLQAYEDWSSGGGLYDPAGLSLLAHRHVGALKQHRPDGFKYRAVLVDEVQDLGRVELEILNALAPRAEDGLFLVGDTRQQVFPKDHDLAGAGIEVRHRRSFKKNYRNTRQVLEAGVALIRAFGPTDAADEQEVLDPEFSERESARPLVVAAESEARELSFIRHYVDLKRRIDDHPVCIVPCGVREDDEAGLSRMQAALRDAGLETSLLRRDSRLRPGGVFLSPLETVKGFEFSLVIVAQCSSATMPVPSLPQEEAWRDASRLYVALTRARDELILTYAGEPSRFLVGVGEAVQWSTASEQGLSTKTSAVGEMPARSLPASPPPAPPQPRIVVDRPLHATSAPTPNPPRPRVPSRNDELLAELNRLKSENQKLKQVRPAELRVSEKGGVSVYGLGRYPVTLYKDQWLRLLSAEPDIRKFLSEHEAELASKGKGGGGRDS